MFFRSGTYEEGDIVSDFVLTSLDGKETYLSQYQGKVVFLEFFVTYCPVCRTAWPQTAQLPGLLPDATECAFLSINRGEDRSQVATYVQSQPKRWPVLLDPGKEVYSAFFSKGVPAFAIIGRDGRLAYRNRGWWSSDRYALDTLAGEIQKAAN